jgi:hypothetical protein
MPNFQVPNEVPIVSEILEKLDPEQTDDNLQRYFLYSLTDQIGQQEGKAMAKCRICDKIYKRKKGNTNAITYHLKVHHPQLWEIYEKAQIELNHDLQHKKLLHATSSGWQ